MKAGEKKRTDASGRRPYRVFLGLRGGAGWVLMNNSHLIFRHHGTHDHRKEAAIHACGEADVSRRRDADAACHGHGEDSAAADHAVEREAAAACVAEHQARAEFVVDEVGVEGRMEDGKRDRGKRKGTEGNEGNEVR